MGVPCWINHLLSCVVCPEDDGSDHEADADDAELTAPTLEPCQLLSLNLNLATEARLPAPTRRSTRQSVPSVKVLEQAASLQALHEERAAKKSRRSDPRRITEEKVMGGKLYYKVQWQVRGGSLAQTLMN